MYVCLSDCLYSTVHVHVCSVRPLTQPCRIFHSRHTYIQRFSTSSASSHSTSTLLGSSLEEINPFQPHIINMMLNKVGIPLEKMESLNEKFPKIRNGSDLVLGREEFQSMRLLAEGGFAKVYVGVQGQTKKALKVCEGV